MQQWCTLRKRHYAYAALAPTCLLQMNLCSSERREAEVVDPSPENFYPSLPVQLERVNQIEGVRRDAVDCIHALRQLSHRAFEKAQRSQR